MEADVNLAQANEETSLETLNDLSEEQILGDYLSANLHGPRWVLGLDGKAI